MAYLRPSEGIVSNGTGPGIDRGGINWDGICYRVMGSKLVSISSTGTTTTLGDVGNDGLQVTLTYSFDLLAIASNGKLYYWDKAVLTQVTDPDLGLVIDVVWVDGYFMTTDGTSLVITELNDPFSVNPLKYGSSEVSPDPVNNLLKLRNEIYALNRYTVEVFQNIQTTAPFPFQRIPGAQMVRGTLGVHTTCVFMESIVFLGGGEKESVAIWVGVNGQSTKISTREIEQILKGYSESELALSVMEARVLDAHQFVYLHLSDRTLVYDAAASILVKESIWFELTTSVIGLGQYRAWNFVWCYDKWLCGDPTSTAHGYMTDTVSSHYGLLNGWQFGTVIMYNSAKGAIINELELVALTGNVAFGDNSTIWTSYSIDGQVWSLEKGRAAGRQGERNKRLTWFKQGFLRKWRVQRFRGTSDAHLSIASLELTSEPLNV